MLLSPPNDKMFSADVGFQAILRNPVYYFRPSFAERFKIMVWSNKVGRSSRGVRIYRVNKGDKITSGFDKCSHLLSPLISTCRGDSYKEPGKYAAVRLTESICKGEVGAAYVKS